MTLDMTKYSGEENAKNLEAFLQLLPENSATNTPSIIGIVVVGLFRWNSECLASGF